MKALQDNTSKQEAILETIREQFEKLYKLCDQVKHIIEKVEEIDTRLHRLAGSITSMHVSKSKGKIALSDTNAAYLLTVDCGLTSPGTDDVSLPVSHDSIAASAVAILPPGATYGPNQTASAALEQVPPATLPAIPESLGRDTTLVQINFNVLEDILEFAAADINSLLTLHTSIGRSGNTLRF